MSLVEAITDVIHDGLFPAWTDSTSWLIDSVSYGGDNSTGGLVASSSATVVSMMASGSLRLLCDSCSFDPHVTRISFWAKGAAVLPSSPAPLTLEVSASEILTLGNIEALSPVLLNVGSLAATDGSAEDAQEWVYFSAFLGSGGNVAVLPPEGALFDTIAFNNFNQEPLAFELDLLRVIVPVSESQGRGGKEQGESATRYLIGPFRVCASDASTVIIAGRGTASLSNRAIGQPRGTAHLYDDADRAGWERGCGLDAGRGPRRICSGGYR